VKGEMRWAMTNSGRRTRGVIGRLETRSLGPDGFGLSSASAGRSAQVSNSCNPLFIVLFYTSHNILRNPQPLLL